MNEDENSERVAKGNYTAVATTDDAQEDKPEELGLQIDVPCSAQEEDRHPGTIPVEAARFGRRAAGGRRGGHGGRRGGSRGRRSTSRTPPLPATYSGGGGSGVAAADSPSDEEPLTALVSRKRKRTSGTREVQEGPQGGGPAGPTEELSADPGVEQEAPAELPIGVGGRRGGRGRGRGRGQKHAGRGGGRRGLGKQLKEDGQPVEDCGTCDGVEVKEEPKEEEPIARRLRRRTKDATPTNDEVHTPAISPKGAATTKKTQSSGRKATGPPSSGGVAVVADAGGGVVLSNRRRRSTSVETPAPVSGDFKVPLAPEGPAAGTRRRSQSKSGSGREDVSLTPGPTPTSKAPETGLFGAAAVDLALVDSAGVVPCQHASVNPSALSVDPDACSKEVSGAADIGTGVRDTEGNLPELSSKDRRVTSAVQGAHRADEERADSMNYGRILPVIAEAPQEIQLGTGEEVEAVAGDRDEGAGDCTGHLAMGGGDHVGPDHIGGLMDRPEEKGIKNRSQPGLQDSLPGPHEGAASMPAPVGGQAEHFLEIQVKADDEPAARARLGDKAQENGGVETPVEEVDMSPVPAFDGEVANTGRKSSRGRRASGAGRKRKGKSEELSPPPVKKARRGRGGSLQTTGGHEEKERVPASGSQEEAMPQAGSGARRSSRRAAAAAMALVAAIARDEAPPEALIGGRKSDKRSGEVKAPASPEVEGSGQTDKGVEVEGDDKAVALGITSDTKDTDGIGGAPRGGRGGRRKLQSEEDNKAERISELRVQQRRTRRREVVVGPAAHGPEDVRADVGLVDNAPPPARHSGGEEEFEPTRSKPVEGAAPRRARAPRIEANESDIDEHQERIIRRRRIQHTEGTPAEGVCPSHEAGKAPVEPRQRVRRSGDAGDIPVPGRDNLAEGANPRGGPCRTLKKSVSGGEAMPHVGAEVETSPIAGRRGMLVPGGQMEVGAKDSSMFKSPLREDMPGARRIIKDPLTSEPTGPACVMPPVVVSTAQSMAHAVPPPSQSPAPPVESAPVGPFGGLRRFGSSTVIGGGTRITRVVNSTTTVRQSHGPATKPPERSDPLGSHISADKVDDIREKGSHPTEAIGELGRKPASNFLSESPTPPVEALPGKESTPGRSPPLPSLSWRAARGLLKWAPQKYPLVKPVDVEAKLRGLSQCYVGWAVTCLVPQKSADPAASIRNNTAAAKEGRSITENGNLVVKPTPEHTGAGALRPPSHLEPGLHPPGVANHHTLAADTFDTLTETGDVEEAVSDMLAVEDGKEEVASGCQASTGHDVEGIVSPDVLSMVAMEGLAGASSQGCWVDEGGPVGGGGGCDGGAATNWTRGRRKHAPSTSNRNITNGNKLEMKIAPDAGPNPRGAPSTTLEAILEVRGPQCSAVGLGRQKDDEREEIAVAVPMVPSPDVLVSRASVPSGQEQATGLPVDGGGQASDPQALKTFVSSKVRDSCPLPSEQPRDCLEDSTAKRQEVLIEHQFGQANVMEIAGPAGNQTQACQASTSPPQTVVSSSLVRSAISTEVVSIPRLTTDPSTGLEEPMLVVTAIFHEEVGERPCLADIGKCPVGTPTGPSPESPNKGLETTTQEMLTPQVPSKLLERTPDNRSISNEEGKTSPATVAPQPSPDAPLLAVDDHFVDSGTTPSESRGHLHSPVVISGQQAAAPLSAQDPPEGHATAQPAGTMSPPESTPPGKGVTSPRSTSSRRTRSSHGDKPKGATRWGPPSALAAAMEMEAREVEEASQQSKEQMRCMGSPSGDGDTSLVGPTLTGHNGVAVKEQAALTAASSGTLAGHASAVEALALPSSFSPGSSKSPMSFWRKRSGEESKGQLRGQDNGKSQHKESERRGSGAASGSIGGDRVSKEGSGCGGTAGANVPGRSRGPPSFQSPPPKGDSHMVAPPHRAGVSRTLPREGSVSTDSSSSDTSSSSSDGSSSTTSSSSSGGSSSTSTSSSSGSGEEDDSDTSSSQGPPPTTKRAADSKIVAKGGRPDLRTKAPDPGRPAQSGERGSRRQDRGERDGSDRGVKLVPHGERHRDDSLSSPSQRALSQTSKEHSRRGPYAEEHGSQEAYKSYELSARKSDRRGREDKYGSRGGGSEGRGRYVHDHPHSGGGERGSHHNHSQRHHPGARSPSRQSSHYRSDDWSGGGWSNKHESSQHMDRGGSRSRRLKHLGPPRSSSSKSDSQYQRTVEDGNYVNGQIFVCNNRTYPECMHLKLFGSARECDIHDLNHLSMVLLWNYELGKMYGVYQLEGDPAYGIVPKAWKGYYPHQVRIRHAHVLPPLDGDVVEKYVQRRVDKEGKTTKFFEQRLTAKQCRELWAAFLSEAERDNSDRHARH